MTCPGRQVPRADGAPAGAPDLVAAVLAGGRATRYGGHPKGRLPLADGTMLVARAVAAAGAVTRREVLIVANDAELYRDLGLPTVPDRRPGAGPLGGIEAALHYYAGGAVGVLILPCDLPGINEEVTATLAAAYRAAGGRLVVARLGASFWQPLCVIVPNGLQPAVGAALDRGEHRVGALWQELGAVPVIFPETAAPAFFNVNTPADLARWQQLEARACPPV